MNVPRVLRLSLPDRRSQRLLPTAILLVAVPLWLFLTASCALKDDTPQDDLATMAQPTEAAKPAASTEPQPTAEPTPRPVMSPEVSQRPRGGQVFTPVTRRAGVGFFHHGGKGEAQAMGAGVVVFDFDDDGFQDIYVTDAAGPNALYRNNGDGTFSDVAAAAGVDDPSGEGNGGCAADYDNDGDRDLFLTNFGPSRLFRNDGDGTFTEATAAANLSDSEPELRSMGCAWGDYDADGHLDFVVVRHLRDTALELLDSREFLPVVGPLALYHNVGDGTFTDVTALLGDTSDPRGGEQGESLSRVWGAGFQPGWLDYDNDGDPDLYVVNDFGRDVQPNALWRNDGPSEEGEWNFTDATEGSGAGVPMFGMGLAVGDYDLDGFLDIYATNIGDNVLLRNSGDGSMFTDVAEKAGVRIRTLRSNPSVTWGALFFDYDNDGDEDLYVVTGMLSFPVLGSGSPELGPQPNVLFRNNLNGTFSNVSARSGADDPGIGRGGAYLDFNNDGCLDLYVVNFVQEATLLENACRPDHNWLVVETLGTVSNRDGIGARITVVAGSSSQIREIRSGSSQMSQNMLPAHFGLGNFTKADFVLVRWPSGVVQTLEDVPANQRITVSEPGQRR